MHRHILPTVLISFFFAGHLMAQQTLSVATGPNSTPGTGTFHYGNRNEPARAVEFETESVTAAQFLANINRYFNIPAEFTFTEAESNTDKFGMRHRLLQQYYKGIPLEGLGYRMHERNGFVTSANGKAVRNIHLNTQTTVSEAQAFDLATKYLNTRDSVFRQGKKLIVSKDFAFTPESFSIAYQFDLDVSLTERWRVSIDARTGQLVNKISLVQSCGHEIPPEPSYIKGTGMTRHYGMQPIRIEKSSGNASLQGQTEHGGYIGTYDFKNAPQVILALGIPYKTSTFYSPTTTFDNGAYERPAVSVHWAAEQAYEYYFIKHSRKSFDNKGTGITNYVHVDVGLNNAFWTGKLLAFGDGSNNNPLVELDVVGHELTHGVTQYEAALTYSNEPGALNESFSDIIAKAIEFSAFGDTATWQMGRHLAAGGLRDMSNPNLKGQPDTYAGDLWYTGTADYGGVHYNSGVQNFWFYLLCQGGSGVNDRKESYAINTIGMEAATRIVYRNLTEYLSSSSDYLDSRIGSLLAAADLYGKNSAIYHQVDKAWDAVGVIDEPIIQSFELYDIFATTVKARGMMIPRADHATYHFEYGTTPAYGTATPATTYVDKVEATITGLQSQTKYYLRLVATNVNGSSYATTEFTTPSLAPLVKITPTIDITETTAMLHGQVNPNSLTTSFYFEYGLTPALGMVTSTYPVSNASQFLPVSAEVTGLQPRKTYYYRLVASNSFASTQSETLSLFTAAKPVILSFTPVTGAIDTEVTITGQNFNTVPDKNLVTFGATRGTVWSASPTELKVKVPVGATFGPISILDAASGLTGQSAQEFVPTFAGGYKKGDLQLRASFNPGDDITRTVIQDMDGDGKPDIFGCSDTGFIIFQNVNNPGGDITENSFVQNVYNVTNLATDKFLADMDGNGLKDVVTKYNGGVRIYPNQSVPGYIFFGTPVDIPLGLIWYITLSDFDQDGRIDIAGETPQILGNDQFTIFRNKNAKGTISADGFEKLYSFGFSLYMAFVTASDLNNDGAVDVLMTSDSKTYFQILKNNSRPGQLVFEEKTIQDPTRAPGGATTYMPHDMNGDGWKDIVSQTLPGGGKAAVWENKGTAPDITITAPEIILTETMQNSMQTGDINGDGKPDVVVANVRGLFKILENKSSTGQPLSPSSFEKLSELGMAIPAGAGNVGTELTVGDLNGDGRPEVILVHDLYYKPEYGHQMQIWQNSPGNCIDPADVKVSVSGTTVKIELPPNTTFDDFEIDYSLGTDNNWQRIYSETISHLSAGADYQLRARAKCYLDFTEYHYTDFTTECYSIDGFSIGTPGVDFTPFYYSQTNPIEVQYSPAGQDQWQNLPDSYRHISGLLPGTTYDLRYRARCVIPATFQYLQFTTQCPALTNFSVYQTHNSATLSWSSNYYPNTHAVVEYSADNTTWILVDETTRRLYPLEPGKQYAVRAKLDCTNIDSELYTMSFTTPCPSLSTIQIDNMTPFGASVHWTDESGTGLYTLIYSDLNSNKVTTVEVNAMSFELEGLTPGTPYSIAVAPACSGQENFTDAHFTTLCYAPFNLSVKDITYTSAELSWSSNFNGAPYAIDYSIGTSKVWETVETTGTSIKLTELRPGSLYEARVHISCASETPPYASLFFETNLYDKTRFAPNPTESTITIQPAKSLIGNRFDIFDNMGRNVASGRLADYTFDLSSFSPGLYTLKVEGESVMRIIKR